MNQLENQMNTAAVQREFGEIGHGGLGGSVIVVQFDGIF
jgi:hypothetical protein